MHINKRAFICWAIFIMACAQVINIICAIHKLGNIMTLFPRMIKQITEDTFVCRSDTTVVYYLYSKLCWANFLNTVLIIGIILALVVYYKMTKSKSSIILLGINVVLFGITVVPFFLEYNYGNIIRWTIYGFAFLTANYESVPFIIGVYAVLLVGYLLFFVSCIRRYFKSRKAETAGAE